MRENLRAIRLRVGRNVQRVRKLRGLTQEALAEAVGNTSKHIGQVERGEVNVGLDILSRIAAALSIEIDDLFMQTPPRDRAGGAIHLISDRDVNQMEQMLRRVRSTSRRSRSVR